MYICNIVIINVKIFSLNEVKLIFDMFLSRISILDDRVFICFLVLGKICLSCSLKYILV